MQQFSSGSKCFCRSLSHQTTPKPVRVATEPVRELSLVPQKWVEYLIETCQEILDVNTAETNCIDYLVVVETDWTGMFSWCFPSPQKVLNPKPWIFHFLQNICKNIPFCIPIFFVLKLLIIAHPGKKFSSKKLIAIKNESHLLWSG